MPAGRLDRFSQRAREPDEHPQGADAARSEASAVNAALARGILSAGLIVNVFGVAVIHYPGLPYDRWRCAEGPRIGIVFFSQPPMKPY